MLHSFRRFFTMELGKDFWIFRLGQLVSVIGDACSTIALAWWILEKTGSAGIMSSVIAPAAFVRFCFLPLLGPLGDRFSRKWLVIISDSFRSIMILLISGMVYLQFFNLPLIIILYMINGIGSALFMSVEMSIIPQLVSKNHLQSAIQQTQAVNSIGSILGGIIGGVLVVAIGIDGAFLLDGLSFLAAAIALLFISSNTNPQKNQDGKDNSNNFLKKWFAELKDGFITLFRWKTLFYFAIVAMAMNFVLSPIGIVLPMLVKTDLDLPAWYLGALQSSISVGAILSSFFVGYLTFLLRRDWVLLSGIGIMGIGIILLSICNNSILILVVVFSFGIGTSLANIPIKTQMTLSIPDNYRSRIFSTIFFFSRGIAPIGIGCVGLLITIWGLDKTLLCMGGILLLLIPLLLCIPHYKKFLRANPQETSAFFEKYYPNKE